MKNIQNLKAFVIYDEGGWDSSFGATSKQLKLIVMAESAEKIAEYFGGKYLDTYCDDTNYEPGIFIPKSLFTKNNLGMLEYKKNSLWASISKSDQGKFFRIEEIDKLIIQ